MQPEQAKQEYEFYCEAFRLCGSFANRAYSRHDGNKQSFWEKQEELVLALALCRYLDTEMAKTETLHIGIPLRWRTR